MPEQNSVFRSILGAATRLRAVAACMLAMNACGGNVGDNVSGGGASTTAGSSGGAGESGGTGGKSGGNAGSSGVGATSDLGAPCALLAAISCAGEHQKLKLVCGAGGVWEANGTCRQGEFCQSAQGQDRGICLPEAEECRGEAPSARVCTGDELRECGPDALDSKLIEACEYGCAAGACLETAVCEAGWSNCDKVPDCEADTRSSALHCGACGHACAGLPNSSGACLEGACACAPNYVDCSNAPGCETNVQTDPKNCGACGVACGSGECVAGVCATRVFISSSEFSGNLGGLAGADQKCQGLADSAGLAGAFRAWLGDQNVAVLSRFVHSPAPYRRIDGVLVASDWDHLLKDLSARIIVDETGAPLSEAYARVWTGDGAVDYGAHYCGNWTSNASSTGGLVGNASFTSWEWRATGPLECGGPTGVARLYCFEVLPVP